MFEPGGDGRIAEVFGDLEAAANVAVVLPGMDNEAANYDARLRASGQNLQNNAGPETATIAWLGYDTPEGADVGWTTAQRIAAGRLAGFLEGLTAYGDKHATVIGHSYGSTVVARAAAHNHMPADNLVFAGSPGISRAVDATPSPDDFNGYSLYYGETRTDFVTHVGGIAHGLGPDARPPLPHRQRRRSRQLLQRADRLPQ